MALYWKWKLQPRNLLHYLYFRTFNSCVASPTPECCLCVEAGKFAALGRQWHGPDFQRWKSGKWENIEIIKLINSKFMPREKKPAAQEQSWKNKLSILAKTHPYWERWTLWKGRLVDTTVSPGKCGNLPFLRNSSGFWKQNCCSWQTGLNGTSIRWVCLLQNPDLNVLSLRPTKLNIGC